MGSYIISWKTEQIYTTIVESLCVPLSLVQYSKQRLPNHGFVLPNTNALGKRLLEDG